jgi:tetratricopeptide (TPR) repeat protein
MSGNHTEEILKRFFEKTKEDFDKGPSDFDSDLFHQTLEKGLHVGQLYVGFMDACLKSMNAYFGDEDPGDGKKEFEDRIIQKMASLYHEVMGRYLNMPQFGLGRESLQKALSAVDAYYKLLGSAGQFFMRFNVPFKESMDMFQDRLKGGEGSDRIETAKDFYDTAVKLLEERYDRFLKSDEGVQGVVDVVEHYLVFKKRYDDAMEGWAKIHAIPTKREMEDVYHNIYQLKKRLRDQEQIIREQQTVIEHLKLTLHGLQKKRKGTKKANGPRRQPGLTGGAKQGKAS